MFSANLQIYEPNRKTTEAEIEVHFPLRLWSQIDRFAGVDVFVWRLVALLWHLMDFEPGREWI